jgi:hypothetical protein
MCRQLSQFESDSTYCKTDDDDDDDDDGVDSATKDTVS